MKFDAFVDILLINYFENRDKLAYSWIYIKLDSNNFEKI